MTHSLFGIISSSISGHLTSFFSSLYESFQALTSVQVSHFVEWFSGSSLNTNTWKTHNDVGTPTYVMDDAIDGGLKVTCTSENNANASVGWASSYNGAGKRHYDHQNSVYIDVLKVNTAQSTHNNIPHGFSENQRSDAAGNNASVFNSGNGFSAFFQTRTVSGTGTQTDTSTAVAFDNNWHVYKIVLGASDNKFYVDGVLKVTATTTLPAAKVHPISGSQGTSGGSPSYSIRYVEAYNTSVTLLSSLYERLSALTQVLKQRVVEEFSGSGLNTNRWSSSATGTGTNTIADEIDGGLIMTTGANTNDGQKISFNNKRQYDYLASVFISVTKMGTTTNTDFRSGLSGNSAFGAHHDSAYILYSSDGTIYGATYPAGGGENVTSLSLSTDTNWHSNKIECKSASVEFTVDGVLKATRTTSLPSAKMQPVAQTITASASAKSCYVRYIEAYNKLTTETSYPSFYEMFQALTTIAKQRFEDWFDGNGLDTTRWTTRTIAGAGGSSAIDDSIDGGFQLIATSGSNNVYGIDFNDKRQYDYQNSTIIAVMKKTTARNTDMQVTVGMTGLVSYANSYFAVGGLSTASTSFFVVRSFDSTTSSDTVTDLALDTSWHSYKCVASASDLKVYIDGVLKVTKTTNLPVVKLQPSVVVQATNTVGDMQMNIRYFEAKNT